MERIVFLALTTEALWETIKMAKTPKEIKLDRLGAMALGIIIAFSAGIDIFEIAGIPLNISYLGYIITGILISRGANFVHDIIEGMNSIYIERKNRIK